MSEHSNNTKMICEKLDRVSDAIENTNKILSSFLLQATSESKFIKMTGKRNRKRCSKICKFT